MMRTIRPILFSLFALAIAAGCQANRGGSGEPDALADPNNQEAVSIYRQHCISCHASDLGGRVGPGLTDVGASMTPEQIAGKIAAGGRGMPAFSNRLTEEEINLLAEWLDRL